MEEWWLKRGFSVFREGLGGLVKGWLAKLAALYFELRHPSKFIMGDINKDSAKRTKIYKKIAQIKRKPCLQELNVFFEGLEASPGALSPSLKKFRTPVGTDYRRQTTDYRRTLWSAGNYRTRYPL